MDLIGLEGISLFLDSNPAVVKICGLDKYKTPITIFSEDLKNVRLEFRSFLVDVLGTEAILFVKQNAEGNFDFNALFTQSTGSISPISEDQGTSYKKMLCVAFDLAVLKHYQTKCFYHFVYHDGVFEGLDNRKKMNLLEKINQYTSTGIQYILTVIDSDLPRDGNDQKKYFSPSEIIRELNDSGQDGRLFNCPIF